MGASLLAPVMLFLIPNNIYYLMTYNYFLPISDYKIMATLMCLIIFSAHFRNND